MDIDIDFEASKRKKVVKAIKDYFVSIGGELVPVCTFGTETSKAALQTAARGLGYEPEIGTYLSSLVPIDRGFVRSLSQCYYGDEEKQYNPIPQFVNEMEKYADVWKVAQGIEGLISRRGRHACGVLPINGNFFEFNAMMKSPDGEYTTQWELHDSEQMGAIKYDFLTTDFLDRIHVCLNLLVEHNHIEYQGSLRKTYDKYIHPSKLNYSNKDMWALVGENKIQSLFQFDTNVGLQTAKQVKPTSLGELAQANSLMRLMPEGQKKTPTELYIENKNNMNLFYEEIDNLLATKEEKDALMEILEPLYGIADGQEAAMRLLMHPVLFNFSIKEGHGARKLIAKKKIKEIAQYRENLYKIGKEKGISPDVIHYIWDVQIGRQLGYSFSYPHTIAYSTIAIQALNLAYFYPIIYWNTACLIVDSDGIVDEDEELNENDIDEDLEDDDEEENKTKKKKSKVINYGKISTAIGKMKKSGINVVPPDINRSSFTFEPDEERQLIIYGIKGITRINEETASLIIANRPYSSLNDLMEKVKLTKLQIVNLIKSGALDSVMAIPREEIMKQYLSSIANFKKKLTLQNMSGLIKSNIIPQKYEDVKKIYRFNKFIKTQKQGVYYILDDYSQNFYEKHWSLDDLTLLDDGQCGIYQKDWDKKYKNEMNAIRPWLSETNTLELYNDSLYQEVKEKYASGSIEKWEMDSIGFYNKKHDLDRINLSSEHIVNFNNLPEEPIVDKAIEIKGKEISLYQLSRIAGTVIEKNKLKNTITLLTQDGVVKVKIYKPQFVKYDRQLFSKNEVTGKKTVIEKSWFTRGNFLILTGIRRGDFFIPKVYKNKTTHHPIELMIVSSNDNKYYTQFERAESEEEN